MEIEKAKRIYSFDAMRIIAACAVVMIHTSADYIEQYDKGTMAFITGNIFNSISRFAVPVFFMISGALMLDERKSIPAEKILKSALQILTLIFSWSFIYTVGYNVIRPVIFNEPISLTKLLDTFFNGHYHMWYLYVLVGLYLITPVLRLFIKKENASLIWKYLVFSMVVLFGVLFANEIINKFFEQKDILLDFANNFRMEFFCEHAIFYVLGWYIVHIGLNKKTRVFLYVGGLAGLVVSFVGTHLFYIKGESEFFHSNDSLNIMLYSVAVFVIIHYIFINKDIALNHVWISLSSLTFGVYLIHCIYLFAFKLICKRIGFALLEILIIFVGSTLLSFVTIFIMSKIPVIKKLIRG